MAVLRFSSRTIPEKDRVAVIQDVWAPVTKVDIAPADRRAFDVDATAHILPSLSIGWGRFASYRATRTRALAADSSDDIVFCLLTDTPWVASQDGKESTVCGAGEFFVNVSDAPANAWLPARSNQLLNVSIPRDVLAPSVEDLDSVSKTVLPATPAARLFKAYVLALVGVLESLSPEDVARTQSHVQDLAVMALGARRDAGEVARKRGVRAARLQAVKADIAANLAHPDFSMAWIARRHRISPRYLRELFGTAGTSFSDYTLDRRLAHARQLLGESGLADARISTIALESGFGDLSYFNRTFRQKFGMTPTEARTALRVRTKDRS